MNLAPVVFHVGYAKCASTTIQRVFLGRHEDIVGMPYSGFVNDDDRISKTLNIFYRNLLLSSCLEYDKEYNRKLFNELLHNCDASKVLFLSAEAMTVQFYTDVTSKAHRLHELAPEAKIVIVIRNQLDLLRSLYDMLPGNPFGRLSMGTHLGFDEWLNISVKYPQRSIVGTLYYDKVIELYYSLFEPSNVGVFFYEDLCVKPDIFWRNLSNFCEVDEVATASLMLNAPMLNPARAHKLGRIGKKVQLFPLASSVIKILPEKFKSLSKDYISKHIKNTTISEYQSEYIFSMFSNSNTRLSKILKRDVNSIGYR